MKPTRNPNAALIAEINAFCDQHGMSRSAFGVEALNDPSFYNTLLAGRDCRLSTLERVRAAMARIASGAAA